MFQTLFTQNYRWIIRNYIADYIETIKQFVKDSFEIIKWFHIFEIEQWFI